MSIDREFTLLNKTRNSLVDGDSSRNSIRKGRNKPGKMANFVKDSTLKYLIPALMITLGGIGISRDKKYKDIQSESTASPSMKYDYINFNGNTIETKISDGFLSIKKNNPDVNSQFLMDDDNYSKDYISSIPLDEEYDYAPGLHMSQTPEEDLYLMMYRKLSTEDYQDMFKGLKKLKQGALGNCYFVVAIKNLARSKYFDTLMMTSIEKSGENSFNLYMPLGEPGGMKVSISNEDLRATTIGGPLGYKILEIGFAKYLLFKEGIIPNTDIIMTNELMKKMKSGYPGDAMMSLLGPKNFENKCVEIKEPNKLWIIHQLNNFDPKNLGTIFAHSNLKDGETDENFYEVGGERIYYKHAYSVCGIEKDGDSIKNVILDNPRNNEKKLGGSKIKLGISDFLNSFYIVNIGHITNSFLNLNTTGEEMQVIDKVNRKKL